jgi:hypothetical protein
MAAAADTATTSDRLRSVLRRAFDGWEEQLVTALVQLGVPAERAPGLAILVISALEGAIVMSRVKRDLTPLDVLVAELGPLLDDAVTRTPKRRRR